MNEQLIPIDIGYDDGDRNCSETGYVVPSHLIPNTSVLCGIQNIIIPEKNLSPDPDSNVFATWTCQCTRIFSVYIQLS